MLDRRPRPQKLLQCMNQAHVGRALMRFWADYGCYPCDAGAAGLESWCAILAEERREPEMDECSIQAPARKGQGSTNQAAEIGGGSRSLPRRAFGGAANG